MKRILIVLLITLLVLALLGAVGVLLFRHFVTDQITDRGGMENPDAGLDAVYSPCGADLCRRIPAPRRTTTITTIMKGDRS